MSNVMRYVETIMREVNLIVGNPSNALAHDRAAYIDLEAEVYRFFNTCVAQWNENRQHWPGEKAADREDA